jgi:hypothetical protein
MNVNLWIAENFVDIGFYVIIFFVYGGFMLMAAGEKNGIRG